RERAGARTSPAASAGPGAARLACGVGAERAGDAVAVVDPGPAALHIAEEAVHGITGPAGHRGQRLDLALVDGGGEDSVRGAAAGVGPIIIALYAEHPRADL